MSNTLTQMKDGGETLQSRDVKFLLVIRDYSEESVVTVPSDNFLLIAAHSRKTIKSAAVVIKAPGALTKNPYGNPPRLGNIQPKATNNGPKLAQAGNRFDMTDFPVVSETNRLRF